MSGNEDASTPSSSSRCSRLWCSPRTIARARKTSKLGVGGPSTSTSTADGLRDLVLKLGRLGPDERRLMQATALNDVDAVTRLLAVRRADPNVRDRLRRSPLHVAASRGYTDVVAVLLEFGADPNYRDIRENTPLHLAACTNNLEVVTLLLDAGTDVGSIDGHGRNPLELAQSKLRLLQTRWSDCSAELEHVRQQLQQIIELMLSFLRRQQADVHHLEIIKLQISESTNDQLDQQMSFLSDAIRDFRLK